MLMKPLEYTEHGACRMDCRCGGLDCVGWGGTVARGKGSGYQGAGDGMAVILWR